MGFREHVADLLTGIDVPFRHVFFPHRLFPLRFQPLSFPYTFHDRKRKRTLHPLIDQIDHNIISGTDRCGNRCLSGFDQLLRIAQPHIGSVRQSGNPDQIRERLRICLLHHLDNEIRSELRDSKTSKRASADVFRFDPERARVVEQ